VFVGTGVNHLIQIRGEELRQHLPID
jgi:hypothetical protein